MLRLQADTQFRFDVATAALLAAILYVSLGMFHTHAATLILLVAVFSRIMPKLARMLADAQHVTAMLPVFVDLAEMRSKFEAAAEPSVAHRDAITFRREIRLEGITAVYEDDARPALDELSLTIRAGETTAIIGPSGSGKSTVADVLMGLIAPVRGRVLIDGSPLRAEGIAAWRDQVGYVAQDTLLFADSLRANLRWAAPATTEEDMRRALRLADALDFASSLPHGLDTPLGERGVLVSGGERQRIALARALLRQPALLILDEATSALDAESERRIQEAIERLAGRMTIVVITHRLATVRGADAIHVVEGGTVVESGDWTSLLQAPRGRFRDLCVAQHLLPEEVAR
jgi:ATP-binding cassette subfamily C protein